MTFRLSPSIWCKWSVDICRMSCFCSPQDQGPIEIRGRISPGEILPRSSKDGWSLLGGSNEFSRKSLSSYGFSDAFGVLTVDLTMGPLTWSCLSFSKFFVTWKQPLLWRDFWQMTEAMAREMKAGRRFQRPKGNRFDFMASPGEALSKASTFQDPVGSPFLDRFAVLWKHHQFCRGWCRLVF